MGISHYDNKKMNNSSSAGGSVRLQTNSNDSDNYNNTNDQSATSFIELYEDTVLSILWVFFPILSLQQPNEISTVVIFTLQMTSLLLLSNLSKTTPCSWDYNPGSLPTACTLHYHTTPNVLSRRTLKNTSHICVCVCVYIYTQYEYIHTHSPVCLRTKTL